MFVFHWGNDSSELGRVGMINCTVCEKTQSALGIVSYKYVGVMWIFSFVTNREYYRTCNRCKNGLQVNAESFGNLAEQDNIPFMRKYGIFFFLALAVFVSISKLF